MASRPVIARSRDDAGRFTSSIQPDLPHGQPDLLPQAALGPASPTCPTSRVYRAIANVTVLAYSLLVYNYKIPHGRSMCLVCLHIAE